MSPTPKRQPMVTCPNCGALNDPARGSKYCFSCNMPLSKATGLQVFDVEGSGWRFGQDGDGTPWAVAADVAKSFDYRDAANCVRMLDADEKGTREVSTPGGLQEMKVIFEDGIWELIFRSTKPEAKAIKKRVKVILREIRETGSYGVDQARELTRRDLAQMVIAEADRADQAERRAEVAEGTVREIEGANGLTLRMFHKKYFSEVREREFFEHLYAKGYLIDQRGKGKARPDGSVRDGAEHRHPSFKGKPYLYLHFNGVHGDRRRETTRVRPGQPELDFKAALVRDGLKANGNDDGFLFGIEGGA